MSDWKADLEARGYKVSVKMPGGSRTVPATYTDPATELARAIADADAKSEARFVALGEQLARTVKAIAAQPIRIEPHLETPVVNVTVEPFDMTPISDALAASRKRTILRDPTGNIVGVEDGPG